MISKNLIENLTWKEFVDLFTKRLINNIDE